MSDVRKAEEKEQVYTPSQHCKKHLLFSHVKYFLILACLIILCILFWMSFSKQKKTCQTAIKLFAYLVLFCH